MSESPLENGTEVYSIGGRFFVYDEEGHTMVESDDQGRPLFEECPPTKRSAE